MTQGFTVFAERLTGRLGCAAAALLFAFSMSALADDWTFPPRVRLATSPSGEVVALVVPRHATQSGGLISKLPTQVLWYRYASGKLQQYEDREIEVVWPLDVAVSDEGFLALFDAWGGNIEARHALSIVDPAGRLVRRYALEDMFNAEELSSFPATVSHLDWRCGSSTGSWREDGVLEIRDAAGKLLVVSPTTGAIERSADAKGCLDDSEFATQHEILDTRWVWFLAAALAMSIVVNALVLLRRRSRARDVGP